jgi:hypothetical protein
MDAVYEYGTQSIFQGVDNLSIHLLYSLNLDDLDYVTLKTST